MPSIEFNFDKAEMSAVKRLVDRLGSEEGKVALDKLFAELAKRAARWVIRTQLHFQTLRERTGSLARSVEGRSERIDGQPAIRVGVFKGPALKYAGIQEYGTQGKNPESPFPTIYPVNGRALAVPVGHALNAMGVPIVPGGPRAWPGNLQFVPSKGTGGLIGVLVDENLAGKGSPSYAPDAIARINPAVVYLLLAKADISPHFYLRRGIETFMPEVMKALDAMLQAELSGDGETNPPQSD